CSKRDWSSDVCSSYLHEASTIFFVLLNEESPDSFDIKSFLSDLYSSPIKFSFNRKHRNAYFSFSTCFSTAVTRFCFRAVSHNATMNFVYVSSSSDVNSLSNHGNFIRSSSSSILVDSIASACLIKVFLLWISFSK